MKQCPPVTHRTGLNVDKSPENMYMLSPEEVEK